MAWFETGGGVGQTLVETVLWTNSSPTSSFAAQTVTLSDSITNYDYIAVEYTASTSTTTSGKIITSVTEFINGGSGVTNTSIPKLSLYSAPSSYRYCRLAYYSSDTAVYFYDCQRVNQTATDNAYSIPLRIIGIKRVTSGGTTP